VLYPYNHDIKMYTITTRSVLFSWPRHGGVRLWLRTILCPPAADETLKPEQVASISAVSKAKMCIIWLLTVFGKCVCYKVF